MKPGERLNLYDLRVIRRSAYTKDISRGGKEHVVTVWRYHVMDASGAHMVYSGVNLGVDIQAGSIVHWRGTVKGFDEGFNMWRLKRVRVIEDERPVVGQGDLFSV